VAFGELTECPAAAGGTYAGDSVAVFGVWPSRVPHSSQNRDVSGLRLLQVWQVIMIVKERGSL
jgi:hypothetical protein